MSDSPRIRIGNQTAFPAPPLVPFKYAVANGFDAFEFFPDRKNSGEGWGEDDISRESRLWIRDTARSHDIRLSVHAPWPSKPGAPNDLDGTVEFAREIGAVLLNMHLYTDRGAAAYLEEIIPFAGQLAHSGIDLSVENTPDTAPADFNELFALLRNRKPRKIPRIGMCFDLGHANLSKETRNDYLRFIDELDLHVPVTHIHLHENYGDLDTHLPLFTGPSGKDPAGINGFVERMKKRRFSGSIILEQWPQPEGLLNSARDRLFEMIRGVGKTEASSADDFIERIVDANSRFLSWRNRLDWIQGLFTPDADALTPEQLVFIAIYLRFLGTGEVRCSEDGGHYRPSVHAATAHRIYRRLVRMTTPENSFIIRKIYPWLPSFDREFIRAEPLTRIRDIAHRNDIPRQLKEEIKETLQNKLHRSAGPEDLATSEALFKRITARDAAYPPSFVEEFRRFHEELKDFFHAGSLREQLERITRKETVRDTALIRDFLESAAEQENDEQVTKSLELLTLLREKFAEGEFAGDTSAEAQQLQLADIRLEDFSFVLLGRLLNSLDAEKEITWGSALHCVSMTIGNLRLSGFDAEECGALESELKAWAQGFEPHKRLHLLRQKATLERARRLTEAYCHRILTLFPERVRRLGSSLGVAVHSIKSFSEGDIRGHPIFHLSRLVSLLLKNIRSLAALPQWDAIVPGKTSGRVISAQGLGDLPSSFAEPVIAVLEKIGGDEEIPAGMTGLIVAQETPLLSHFAVRARQMGLVFAVCDPAHLNELRTYSGKSLVLNVHEGEVIFESPADPEAAGAEDIHTTFQQKKVKVPDVPFLSGRQLFPLAQATLLTAGGKATAARLLEELSRREGAGFGTPGGVIIPFGVMEGSLHAYGREKEYAALAGELDTLTGDNFGDALSSLRVLIAGVRVPEEIVSGVAKHFGKNARLMVRSSSNCEDLEGFAGAGLYESAANVPLSKLDDTILKVWSSLWTRRAAAGRKNAGIPQEKAHMAVLIQQMMVPDFSFILHTVNPVSGARHEVFMELAVGFGETLASAGIKGVPYRMVFNKKTGRVQTLAFASFSSALYPDPRGGFTRKTVDYSGVRLCTDEGFRNSFGRSLGEIGQFVEKEMGRPQDIEGVVTGETIYLVQSRPQQGNI